VAPSEGLATDLRSEVEKYLPEHLGDLRERVRQAVKLIQPEGTAGFEHLWNVQLERALGARGQALTEISAEADLYVLASRRPAAGSPGQVFNVSGPVGALVTGSHATVTQNFGPQERAVIIRALDQLEAHVPQLPEGVVQREVSELLTEARSETTKPEPNVLRLQGVLTVLATSIQTIASVRPAYEAMKGALALLGISMP
jgi:hypothetical protein